MKFFKILILIISIVLIFILVQNIVLKNIYPLKYTDYIYKYSNEFNVDPYFVLAIIKSESNFNENALSNKNAVGLMQLLDSTASEIALELGMEYKQEDLYNPEINIKLGTKYISNLLNYFGNYQLAIAAYNAGIGNINSWVENNIIYSDGSNIENIPFKETNIYLRKVTRDYNIYSNLYD